MIEFREVHKWFGELHVLKGINLKVAPAEVLVVCGPSGSGKSTIARHAFGQRLYAPGAWEPGQAIVDGFGDAPIKQITGLLTAVGFSSPRSIGLISRTGVCGRAVLTRRTISLRSFSYVLSMYFGKPLSFVP